MARVTTRLQRHETSSDTSDQCEALWHSCDNFSHSPDPDTMVMVMVQVEGSVEPNGHSERDVSIPERRDSNTTLSEGRTVLCGLEQFL